MGDTIATLGIKVTSTGVKETSENLEKVSKSSEKAQKSIDKLLESYKQQEIRAKGGKAGLAEYKLSLLGASEAEKKFAAETIKATEKLNEQAKALRKTEAQTTSTSAIMAKMSSVLATLGTYFSTRKIIEYADTWTTLGGKLKLVTKNTSELIAVQDKLFDLAQETRLSLEGTTDLYARVARSTESVTRSQNDLIQATENINKAMVISGSSVEATNAAIIQLGQGFASGTLQGEELRSVLEQTPRLAKAIADGMGVAVGELRKLGKEGKLTSEVVFKAILSQGDALEKEFGKVPKTVKQGLALVENSILKFIGQMNESYGVTKTLAEWLTVLADNIGDVAKAGFVLLSAAIPATITAIGTATKALYALLIRNPIGLIAAGITSAIAAMILYKDEIIKFGKTNAQALDWVKASWDVLAGGVVTWGKNIYDSVTKYFSGMETILGDIAEYIYSTYTEGFSNILEASKNTVNGLIGEFVGIGKFIGQTTAFIYESFEVAFDGIITMAIAVGKDLKKALSGDVGFSNTIAASSKASEKSLANLQKYVSSTGEIFKDAFTTDYVGMFASEVSKVGNDISKKASEYHATRMANEKEDLDAKKASEKALADKLEAEKRLNEENEKAKKAQEEAAKAEKDRLKSIQDIIENLIQERDTLDMTKEQLVAYKLALLKATPAQIAFATAIQKEISAAEERKKVTADFKSLQEKLNPELKRQNDLMADFKIVNDAFAMGLIKTKDEADKLKKALEFNSFSGAIDELKDKLKFEGTSFGNEIADGINNAVISMQKFNDQLDKQTKYQKDIDKLQKEIDTTSNLDLKAKKQKEMDDLTQEGIKGQLSAYRQLFGTTSQLFKENSKERKVLHNLEMAFAAAEIAMNLQKTISAAYTAIMTQGAGDPYSAFARIAAMTALAGGIVAAAGGSLSGGGSGSAPTAVSGASQSTVLGSSEQSQSISNSFSFLEDIESDQYNELKEISSSMKDLNKNISGLFTSIVRTGGISDFSGVAGTSTTTGSNLLKYGAGTPFLSPILFNDLLQEAKSGMSQTSKDVLTALSPLTFGTSSLISDLVANATSAVFGGSKKTSILASGLQVAPGTIGEILGGQDVSTQAFADIKIKKSGGWFGSNKTYFKTLTEDVDQSVSDMVALVVKNMGQSMLDIAKGLGTDNLEEVFNYVFDIGKIDLKGLSNEDMDNALQEAFSTTSDKAVSDLFGQLIGQYQKVGEGIFETAVRLVGEKAVVLDVLELTNQGFIDSNIPAKALEVTQALIDIAGGLDNLTDAASTYYDKFFNDNEKQARLYGQLTESFEGLNLKLPSTREGYRKLVEGLDLSTTSGQKTYVALLKLSEGADKYYTTLEEGNKKTADATKAEMELSNARKEAIKKTERSLTVELLNAQGRSAEALALSRQLELESMDESLRPMKLRIWQLQDEAAAADLAAKKEKELADAIKDAAKSRKSELETLIKNTVQAQIDSYQELANAANDALSNAEGLLNRSFEAEKKRITTIHESIIEGLTKNLDDAKLSADELRSAFEGLGAAKKAMTLAGTEQITYTNAQSQLFSALGLARQGNFSGAKAVAADTSTLTQDTRGFYSSFEDYQREFFKTKNAITELEGLTSDELSVQETMVSILEQQIALENNHFDKQITTLDEQLDGILGVDNSVVTLTEAITQYQEAQYAADGANTLLKKQTDYLNNMMNTLFDTNSKTGNLVTLIDEYTHPEKYPAQTNVTTTTNSEDQKATNEDLIRQIKILTDTVEKGNFANAKSNLKTATVLNKWDKDGMPATTV